MPDAKRIRAHRRENLKHTVLLVGGMVMLLAALGWSLWGARGFVMLLAIGGAVALLSPRVSPQLIMRMYRGRPLGPGQAPGLVQLVSELARRADLPRPPRLYLIPSPICNAIAVGRPGDSSIGVTACLLSRMTTRELAGVLAHEISHIANHDLHVMGLADLMSRITRFLSWTGQLLLLVNLPLLMMGQVTIPWLFILLLVIAPNLTSLLQLALSRTRELDADLEAVRLTGDPSGLASALAKLERLQGGLWQRIFLPDRGNPEPSVLRTHPTTEERIRRLLDLDHRPSPPVSQVPEGMPVFHIAHLPAARARVPRWHISGLWYCAALVLVVAPRAHALDPDVPISHYTVQILTQDNGLPQDYVSDIAQDRQGYLWLATQEGLARFDGVRFSVFDRDSSPALPERFVVSLHAQDDGAIWIGMRGGTVCRLTQDDGLQVDLVGSALQGSWVRALLLDSAGVLWAGGRGGGLARWDADALDGGLEPVPAFAGARVFDLLEDRSGRIWVATESRGLCRVDGTTLTWFEAGSGLPAGNVRALAEDGDGAVWVAVYDGGLVRFDDGEPSLILDRDDGLVSNRLQALLVDRDQNLWLGSDGSGLVRLRHARVTGTTTQAPLAGLSVEVLAEDREGNLWVGTSGDGLIRLGDSLFTVLDDRSGLDREQVNCVLEGQTTLWVGTTGGLYRVEHDARGQRNARLEPALGARFVASLFEDPDGALWIGTYEEGLARLDASGVRWWSTDDGLPSDSIWSIDGDGSGGVWIGTLGGGAARLSAEGIATFNEHTELANSIVRVIRRDRSNAVWLGTGGGGLSVYRDGEFSVNPGMSSLPNAGVLDFWEDPDGAMWFGTSGSGLCRLSESAFGCLTTEEGLFDNTVYRILVDRFARMWMSCNRGVFTAGVDELRAALDGSTAHVRCRVFGRADGMPTPECNGGKQPAGWLDRDGVLWLPTSKGLAGIDTAAVPELPPAPEVVFEDLRADGNRFSVADAITLPAGTRSVEIDYTALTLVSPDKLGFRYRLPGIQDSCAEVGGRRTVYLTSLPPGDYVLTVQARRSQGSWGPPAPLAFAVRPFLHQRPWFRIGSAVLAAAAAVGLFLWRTRLLRARERMLRQRVDEATAELRRARDDLEAANARLTELSLEDPLTGAANRRRFEQSLDLIWRQAARSGLEVALLMIDIDHFKAFNDCLGHVAGDACLKQVAVALSTGLRRTTDLLARYGGEEFAVILPSTPLQSALELAEKLRHAVEVQALPHPGSAVAQVVTISVGAAVVVPDVESSPGELVRAADQALYRAKEQGRNRVVSGLLR